MELTAAFFSHGARVIIELIALFLMIVGLALGVVGLFGIRKHGTKGILAPALVGVIINGLLAFIFFTNFSAARAGAQRGANATTESPPANPASRQGDARKSYQGEGLVFGFAGAYGLKTNQATGQVFLQHSDSSVVITSRRQLLDAIETLKLQASALQQDFKDHSYGAITQSDFEPIAGAIRSGGLVRMEYDKPRAGRIHADVYILSDQVNSISVLHYYPDARKSNAQGLFQTVLQSLKDGG